MIQNKFSGSFENQFRKGISQPENIQSDFTFKLERSFKSKQPTMTCFQNFFKSWGEQT